MIEYISYFVQDEIINNIRDTPVIINEGMGISICNKDFNENNMNVTVDGKFKFWKSEKYKKSSPSDRLSLDSQLSSDSIIYRVKTTAVCAVIAS